MKLRLFIPALLLTFSYGYSQSSDFTYSMYWEVDGIAAPGDTLTHLVLDIENFKSDLVEQVAVTIEEINGSALYSDILTSSTNNSAVSIEKWQPGELRIDFLNIGSGIYNYAVRLWYDSGQKTKVLKYNSFSNEFTQTLE